MLLTEKPKQRLHWKHKTINKNKKKVKFKRLRENIPSNRKIDESGKDGTPNSLTLEQYTKRKESVVCKRRSKRGVLVSVLKVAIAINAKATEKNRITLT